MLYKTILKPALFTLPPELAHDLTLKAAELAQCTGLVNILPAPAGYAEKLERSIAGIKFSNPLGLAAGFDKNCRIVEFLSRLGFGHIEIGSVTAQPQPGNPKPRIFRLPADQAVINRMGFPSEGAQVVADRLRRLRQRGLKLPVIGVNLGKTKVVPIEQAVADYCESFKAFVDLADYFVLNVSSPNTPDLRKLQEPARLLELFKGVSEINLLKRPVFVKIAPDLSFAEIDDLLKITDQAGIQGIIATNTTFERAGLRTAISETGGLSGEPLFNRARAVVRHLSQATSLPVIAVGGVASGVQALEMLSAGASLIQIYTGLVYQGPGLPAQINAYLAEHL